jgi:hypothetical protein
MPAELKGQLEASAANRGKSLTKEIVDRLERSLAPDASMQLADTLRPFLDNLSERQRRDAVESAARLIELILETKKPRKR